MLSLPPSSPSLKKSHVPILGSFGGVRWHFPWLLVFSVLSPALCYVAAWKVGSHVEEPGGEGGVVSEQSPGPHIHHHWPPTRSWSLQAVTK